MTGRPPASKDAAENGSERAAAWGSSPKIGSAPPARKRRTGSSPTRELRRRTSRVSAFHAAGLAEEVDAYVGADLGDAPRLPFKGHRVDVRA